MELIATKVCKKGDIGVHDNLFGGLMLCWIDEAALSMATSICHTPNMVTLKIHEVLFRSPIKACNAKRCFVNLMLFHQTKQILSEKQCLLSHLYRLGYKHHLI